MDKSREELERVCRGRRYYIEGERKKRNHRLITRGADVESVAPEVRGISQAAFRNLVEQIFSLPEVAALDSVYTSLVGYGKIRASKERRGKRNGSFVPSP